MLPKFDRLMAGMGRKQTQATRGLCSEAGPGALFKRMQKPEWMPEAARAARTLRATTVNRASARHSVYVVLLHDRTRQQPWGLYVGQTSRDPDLRFDQHKAGYKASGPVRRFGVCLLPELTEHLNPLQQWESLDLEAALADTLRQAGIPWVEGGH